MNPYIISPLLVNLSIPANNIFENKSLPEKETKTYVQDVCWSIRSISKNYK